MAYLYFFNIKENRRATLEESSMLNAELKNIPDDKCINDFLQEIGSDFEIRIAEKNKRGIK